MKGKMKKTIGQLVTALIILFLVSLMVSFGFKAIPKAQAAEAHLNACGTLSLADTTYILDNDISDLGTAILIPGYSLYTCFNITANNVILDLNNHTITYGENNTRGFGIWMTGAGSEIKNGTITESNNNTADTSYAVYKPWGLSGPSVHDLTVNTHTPSTIGIYIKDGQGAVRIYNNIFNVSTTVSLGNKDDGCPAIKLMGEAGNNRIGTASDHVLIHHNTVNSATRGVAMAGVYYADVYSNTIRHSSPLENAKNSYGLWNWEVTNSRFWDNSLQTSSGRGITIDGNSLNNEVYNNTVEALDTAGRENIFGMRIRFGSSDNKIHDNTFHVNSTIDNVMISALYLGGTEPVDTGPKTSRNEIYNNNFTNDHNGLTTFSSGIYLDDVGPGNWIHDNQITSNNHIFVLESPNTIPIVVENLTITRGSNPRPTGNTTYLMYDNAGPNRLINLLPTNGVALDDVQVGENGGSLSVEWFLNLVVKDQGQSPIDGATVEIRDINSNLVFSGQTDNEGKISQSYDLNGDGTPEKMAVTLKQYDLKDTGNVLYNPYTITISKTGYSTETKTITMDSSKEMTVILDGVDNEPPIISNVMASNITQTSATITWQTDKAADSEVEYGLDTNYGTILTDVNLTTNHSIQLSNLSPNTYHFRVTSKDVSGKETQGIDHTFFILSPTGQNVFLTKSVDKTSASSGETLTYTINYTVGINPITNARIEDPIPAGTTFISADNGGTSDGTKIVWNLGDLAAGASGTVSFQVRIN